MNTKIKFLLLAAFLVMAIGLKAQEAGGYEYGSVTIMAGATNQALIIATAEKTEEKKLSKSDFNNFSLTNDLSPLHKEVNELAKQGWVVYSASTLSLGVTVYHIRRKIK